MINAELDFEFNGNHYRIGNLDAFSSFHVARKLAPVITSMGSSVFAALKAKDAGEDVALDDIMLLAGPVAEVVSKMSNADVDFVIKTCLSVVRRRSGDSYAPMMSAQGVLMFQDLRMPEMLRVTIEVIRTSLGDFFVMAPSVVAS